MVSSFHTDTCAQALLLENSGNQNKWIVVIVIYHLAKLVLTGLRLFDQSGSVIGQQRQVFLSGIVHNARRTRQTQPGV